MIVRKLLLASLLLVAPATAHAAWALRFTGTAANAVPNGSANSGDITPTLGGTTNAGDIIACFVNQKSATSYTAVSSSGYTQAHGKNGNTSPSNSILLKIAAGGDSNPTITTSDVTSSRTMIGQCAVFSGGPATLTGIVVHSGDTTNGSQEDVDTAAVTITTANTLVIAVGGKNNDWEGQTVLAPTGFTLGGQPERTSSAQVGLAWAYQVQTTATNISAGIFDGQTGNFAAGVSFTVSLQPAVVAPTWSVSATVSAQDDNDYTLSYTPSTSATFYAVACKKDETAPTIAQVKAAHCTGDAAAIASANEAVTGADTTVLGGSLTRPVHDLYAVLSNAAGDSTLVTLADECLDAAAGKTIVNCPSGLTSIHANSPINGFNAAVTPDIVAGDIMVADSTTDLGDALTWTATGLYSYDGNSARRKFSANFYDLSAGANHADTMQVCVNNAAPVASVAYYDAVLVKDHPFTAIDFCTMFSDADDPTLTCTSDEAGTGTGAGTRPAGTTMTAGVFDDTGSGATSADGSTGSLNITATDSCGDTATIPFSWSVYSQVTVPDCVAGSLSACMAALSAINLDTSFESQCSATVAALNVISQTPAASTVVDPFTGVALIVSSGKCSRPARGMQISIGIGVN